MVQVSKPRCFVAMAFDHDDTDALYDRQILPTLGRLGVRAIRIDRQQNNDDINLQIIEQLKNTDFCITDLTYARPSVYFEAGFAQRSGSVIYTVRRDHLSRRQPDALRVHFDLQMKPIIPWSTPADSSFRHRLEKRLTSTVLKEWRQVRAKMVRNAREKHEFTSLPLDLRLRRLRRQAMYAMRKPGLRLSTYRQVRGLAPEYQEFTRPRKHLFDGRYNYLEAAIVRGKRGLLVSIQAFDAVTEKELRRMDELYLHSWRLKLRPDSWKRVESFYHHVLIINIKPLSASRIERAFDYCRPIKTAQTYALVAPITVSGQIVNEEFMVHVLSGIDSFVQSKAWLDALIADYMPKNMTPGTQETMD